MTDAEGLAARLAAMRERQARAGWDGQFGQLARNVPLLRALEEAGEPHKSSSYGKLAGAANQWAHDPDGSPPTVNDALPLSLLDRQERIEEALNRFLPASDRVSVIFRAEALVLLLTGEQVLRYVADVIATGDGGEIGFLLPDGRFLEVRKNLISIGRLGTT